MSRTLIWLSFVAPNPRIWARRGRVLVPSKRQNCKVWRALGDIEINTVDLYFLEKRRKKLHRARTFKGFRSQFWFHGKGHPQSNLTDNNPAYTESLLKMHAEHLRKTLLFVLQQEYLDLFLGFAYSRLCPWRVTGLVEEGNTIELEGD
jgi:hypothetical protein